MNALVTNAWPRCCLKSIFKSHNEVVKNVKLYIWLFYGIIRVLKVRKDPEFSATREMTGLRITGC